MAEVTPEPVVEAAPEATPQAGPWAADLEAAFASIPEEHRAAAIAAGDSYMREKVQPRITHLETESAPARELYKDLMNDAEGTLTAVMEELYGEEKAQAFAALLTPEEKAAIVEAAVEGNPAEAVTETAEQREMREWYEAKRDEEATSAQQQEYDELLTEMRTAHDDLTDEDMDLIHPFISAAGGDTDLAYAGYQQFLNQTKARFGVTEPEPEPTPVPPAVLGSTPGTGGVAAAPPVEKVYKNIDEAFDDFFAERRAQQPPPVL